MDTQEKNINAILIAASANKKVLVTSEQHRETQYTVVDYYVITSVGTNLYECKIKSHYNVGWSQTTSEIYTTDEITDILSKVPIAMVSYHNNDDLIFRYKGGNDYDVCGQQSV